MNDLFADRVELVAATFRKGAQIALDIQDLPLIIMELDGADPEFRAVIYEGAAMQLASNNLESKDHKMPSWCALLAKADCYEIHLHIGLGWALAKWELPLDSLSIELTPFFQEKVLDGAGYFEGLFQRRASIRSQQIPEWVSQDQVPNFDQGIGRAIWYITKGDKERVRALIAHFPIERRSSLWTGVGLASTFVGGYIEEDLSDLEKTAEQHATNLKYGALLAIRGRYITNSLDEYAEIAATSYYKMNAVKVAEDLYSDNRSENRRKIEELLRNKKIAN